jgi:hypothetical protein
MRREALGGWAMIVGAVLGLVTMAFHPTTGEQATLSTAVHSLALFTVPVTFYGGWALTRRLSADGALAELALAFYGASAAAALLAGTASGLLAPDLFARAAGLDGEARAAVVGVMRYNHAVNQAFAKVLVAASSIAIGLWSIEITRTRSMRRTAGILGCVVATLVLLALVSGQVRMDVHGFGGIVLLQAIWLILVGAELRSTVTAAAEPRG